MSFLPVYCLLLSFTLSKFVVKVCVLHVFSGLSLDLKCIDFTCPSCFLWPSSFLASGFITPLEFFLSFQLLLFESFFIPLSSSCPYFLWLSCPFPLSLSSFPSCHVVVLLFDPFVLHYIPIIIHIPIHILPSSLTLFDLPVYTPFPFLGPCWSFSVYLRKPFSSI